ncbi:MAG: PrsW family glutamic-type intramembrane protease [Oscillospiraceae bacterium]|nr:PrsW family glutamic-type intramembrane protease [bacterium]MDY5101435.1 PrsW family glutamic-type intramembrane protease [Oscillospiraceae bacterium]
MKYLLAGALLPALLLMLWIYRMDTVEKEPTGLLVKLALGGAFACLPAALLESFLMPRLAAAMDPETLPFTFALTFGVVAFAEEGCKFLMLRAVSWNDPNFNYRFDGIVYGVFVALGFAALENVQYVLEYGPSVIVSRGLLSIPAHGIFGIYMGLFYANARYADIYRNGAGHRWNMCAALLVPVLLHGFFDFCLMSGSVLLGFIFFGFVVAMDAVSIKLVRRQSREDRPF